MTSIWAVAIYMNLIPIYSSLGCSKSTAWQSLCRRKCHGKCPHGTKETGHWAQDTPSVLLLLLPLPINTMLAKWLNWHIGIVHIGVNVLSITGQPAANCCCFCHSFFVAASAAMRRHHLSLSLPQGALLLPTYALCPCHPLIYALPIAYALCHTVASALWFNFVFALSHFEMNSSVILLT